MLRYTIRPRHIGPDIIIEKSHNVTMREIAEGFARTIGLLVVVDGVKLDDLGEPYLEITIGTDKRFIVFGGVPS
tara:strand:- start:548 stop:769 length:222 start_codon:yes stop_codon:yes gene_type:complete